MEQLKAKLKYISEHNWLIAAVLTLGFVALALGLGYYSNKVIPPNPDPNSHYLAEPGTHLDFMSQWDGPHYLSIAQHGYSNRSLTAFFPLYPLLIRLVMFVAGSPLISALVISWCCLFGAVYFYLKVIRTLFKENLNTALMGVLLFLLFPTGVFLAATYTESLFAFAALGAFYFALKGRYLLAGAFAAAASASHPEGVFISILVALLLWENKTRLWRIGVAAGEGLLGIAGFIAYLGIAKGHPLAFVSAQRGNHWLSGNYISTIVNSITPVSGILFFLVIIAAIYWWRRRRISLAVYSLLFALIPLVGGNFAGFPRYVIMAFPLQFMFLQKFKRMSLAYSLILALSAIGWAYFVIHYAAGYTGGS